jgi:hypothetical protein
MDIKALNNLYLDVKSKALYGRYVTNSDLEKWFETIPRTWASTLGYSVERKPIYGLRIGEGPKKILLWSQMHGNESTTTKALCDCFNLFLKDNNVATTISNNCTLMVIPILNPDGARRYTRLNANGIDLNRDAQNLSQPESKVLRSTFDAFKPDYCFNLHGQRTIFGAGTEGHVATLSFLAPASDVKRSITPERQVAMALISDVNNQMQTEIPRCIGRYDDEFNLNCVGDTFQGLGVPTVLYEAGHFTNDYEREEVRRLLFLSICQGLFSIAKGFSKASYKGYQEIPENVKNFRDIVIRNAKSTIKDETLSDIVIQYREDLKNGVIQFTPIVEAIVKPKTFYAHREIDAEGTLVQSDKKLEIQLGHEIDFVLVNNKKIALKPKNNSI